MPHLSTMLYSEEDKLRDLEWRCGFTKEKYIMKRNDKLSKVTAKRMEKVFQEKLATGGEGSPKIPPLPMPKGPVEPDMLTPDTRFMEQMARRTRDWARRKQAQHWRSGNVNYGRIAASSFDYIIPTTSLLVDQSCVIHIRKL